MLYEVITLMDQICADYPTVTLFSLPAFAEGERRRSVERGVKGPVADVEAAMKTVCDVLAERGYSWDDK